MQQIGIQSVAIKTTVENLSTVKRFYIEFLGGKEIVEMPGSYVIELPDLSIIELYTEISETPDYLFSQNQVVLGYRTDHLQTMFEKIQTAGYPILSSIQHAGNCYSYFHFIDPNNQISMMNEVHKHTIIN